MIKKGDKIIVIAGAYRGKEGKVEKVDKASSRVFVAGVNMKKKHQKATRNAKGQMVEVTHSIHSSNVMLLEGGKRVRTGTKLVGDKKVRVSKKSGNEI